MIVRNFPFIIYTAFIGLIQNDLIGLWLKYETKRTVINEKAEAIQHGSPENTVLLIPKAAAIIITPPKLRSEYFP